MKIYNLKITFLSLVVLSCFLFGNAAHAKDVYKDGCAYYKAGHYEYAKKCFEYLARTQPKNWAAHYQLANTYMKLGERMKARAAYDACIKKLPDFDTAKACQKAIKHIDLLTAKDVIAADKAKNEVKEATEEGKSKEKELSPEEVRRNERLSADKKAYKEKVAALKDKRDQIMRDARKEASRIRAEAKRRIMEIDRNTNEWVINRRTGEVSVGISKQTAAPILAEAERQARQIMHMAEMRAKGIKIPPNPFHD